jgi:hypothetical protein
MGKHDGLSLVCCFVGLRGIQFRHGWLKSPPKSKGPVHCALHPSPEPKDSKPNEADTKEDRG